MSLSMPNGTTGVFIVQRIPAGTPEVAVQAESSVSGSPAWFGDTHAGKVLYILSPLPHDESVVSNRRNPQQVLVQGLAVRPGRECQMCRCDTTSPQVIAVVEEGK